MTDTDTTGLRTPQNRPQAATRPQPSKAAQPTDPATQPQPGTRPVPARPEPAGRGGPGGHRRPPAWAQVQVVLPANLLTGQGAEPAELVGYGPIPTSMAYRMAADASWQRLLTDPANRALTDVGRTRYAPPAALAEFGITRDRRCRFPGCRQPRIDLAHPIPYPHGPTADYIGGLCRPAHHRCDPPRRPVAEQSLAHRNRREHRRPATVLGRSSAARGAGAVPEVSVPVAAHDRSQRWTVVGAKTR